MVRFFLKVCRYIVIHAVSQDISSQCVFQYHGKDIWHIRLVRNGY
jgi:hypothetical protein